jgi:hypothetical protein
MNDENTLRKAAREAIQAGKLPSCPPQRVWGGPGVGARCTICGKSAGPDEVEFELEFTRQDDSGPGNYHVHVQCFAAWEFERQHFEASGGAAALSDRTRLTTPPGIVGGVNEETAVSGSLPAPGNGRMITGHECDRKDGRGAAKSSGVEPVTGLSCRPKTTRPTLGAVLFFGAE